MKKHLFSDIGDSRLGEFLKNTTTTLKKSILRREEWEDQEQIDSNNKTHLGLPQMKREIEEINQKVSELLRDSSILSGDDPTTIPYLLSVMKQQQKLINRQEYILEKQEDITEAHEGFLSTKVKNMINAAIFAIIWGTWATMYWQLSPESSVQSEVSSFVQGLSDIPTGYNTIQSGKKNILIIKAQDEVITNNKNLIELDTKMLRTKDEIIDIKNTEIAKKDETITLMNNELTEANKKIISLKKKVSLLQKTRKWKKLEKVTEKKSVKSAVNNTAQSYEAVRLVRDEVMNEFTDKTTEIKIQEQSGKWILIWLEYNGKKSLGFYANTDKNKDRLTKEGMKLWVQNSLAQLSLVEQIESIAWERNINSSKEGPISLKIKKLDSGNVKVILSDIFSGKTDQFIVDIKKDKSEDISRKIDEVTNKFLLLSE